MGISQWCLWNTPNEWHWTEIVYVTGFAKKGLTHTIIIIEKSHF